MALKTCVGGLPPLSGRQGTAVQGGCWVSLSLPRLVLLVTEARVYGTGDLSVESASPVKLDGVLGLLDSVSPGASCLLHLTWPAGGDGGGARAQPFGRRYLAGMSP